MIIRKRACVIIVDNDKVLLMHRIKNWEEYYTIIGWWIESWETPEQTAIREVKEEANLDIVPDWIFCKILDEWHDGVYYLIKDFKDTVKLSWPEASRMDENNQYYLERINKEKIANIPLLPKEIKQKIIEYFE